MGKKAAKQRIVIALGGNALSRDGNAYAISQLEVAYATAKNLLPLLIDPNKQIAIVHGNGPQIGNIIIHEESINTDKVPTMPIDVCGAMSQGQIGYWLQNQIRDVLTMAGAAQRSVVSVITQVLVDEQDPAFADPSKPIGPFYTAAEAQAIAKQRKIVIKEDAGRGWRRVIASPKPLEIIEADFIKQAISQDHIVISTGGGGIPVIYDDNQQLLGVEAVIDKDFAAEKLAEAIEADLLLILTAVESVKINFNQANEQALRQLTVDQAKSFIAEQQFAPGSMLPKIEAALAFLQYNPVGQVIITNPESIAQALAGQSGTTIIK